MRAPQDRQVQTQEILTAAGDAVSAGDALLGTLSLEGWEPEAAAARRFDETGATKYSLVSHDLIVSQ